MSPCVDLSGQVAVVTGSSRGIGRAIAEALAQAGAKVGVTSRSLEDALAVAGAIQASGGDAVAFQVEVSDAASVDALVAAVLDRFGKVDILVNNAGISPIYTRAENIEEKDWDAIIATNLKGTFLCCQRFGRVMIQQMQDTGCRMQGAEFKTQRCIVNVSSILARSGYPRLAAYAASKAGIEALTRTLAVEWAQYGIRVNCVAPAFIETDLTAGLRANESLRQMILEKTPLRAFGKPEDVAAAVVFICSEQARFITGATLDVDGGWLAQ